MDILLTRYFYPCLFECTFCNLPATVTIERLFYYYKCKSRETSVYVVLNTVYRGNSPYEGAFFIRAHWYRLLCCKASVTPAYLVFFHQKQEVNSSDFFNRPLHRRNFFTLSPTLVDPALVSVIRAVDGQETGLSVQPAEKKNRLQTGQEFHLQSTLVQASLL